MTVIRSKNGKKAGVLKDGKYTSFRKESVHLFRKLDAWGIDYDILYSLPEQCSVQVASSESGRTYKTTKEEFVTKGTVYHFKQGTIDHSVQVFLPLTYWKVTEKKEPEVEQYIIQDPYKGERTVEIKGAEQRKRLFREYPYAKKI